MAEHFRDDSTAAIAVRIDAEHPAGMLIDPLQPQLRLTDLGATRGDGVFETMYAVEGLVRKFPAHISRLHRSAEILQIGIPPAESWSAAVELGISEFATRGEVPAHLSVKLVATRGVDGEPASEDPRFSGTYWILLTPVPESALQRRGAPISVLLLDRGYPSDIHERAPWLVLGAKTLSYAVNMAALRYAEAHGAQDVIFHSSDGQLLEGPTSTVLLMTRTAEGTARLVTPLLESGILPGTTQGAIFAAAGRAGWELGYGPLQREDLFNAEHIWLASSVRLLAPVESVDGHSIAVSSELTAQLAAFLEDDLPVRHPESS